MERELERLQWITLGSVVVLALLCAGLLLIVWLSLNLSQLLERVRATLGRFTTEARRHGEDSRGVTEPRSSQTTQEDGEQVQHLPVETCIAKESEVGLNAPYLDAVREPSEVSLGSPPCLRGELPIEDTVEYAALFRPLKAGDTVIVVTELNWMHSHGSVVAVGELLTLVNSYNTNGGVRWSARHHGHYLSSIPPESIRRHDFQPSPAPPRSPQIPIHLTINELRRFERPPACEREWLAQQHNRLATDSLTSPG